jgi:hypothetical protein
MRSLARANEEAPPSLKFLLRWSKVHLRNQCYASGFVV